MQLGVEQLIRQQEIMRARGYFNGECNGKWGPDSIDAMKLWQLDLPNFLPARPTNGLPFPDERGPYPRGITINRATKLLECPVRETKLIEQQRAAEKPKKGKTEDAPATE